MWQILVASQNCRKEGLFFQKRLDEAIRERMQNGGIVAAVDKCCGMETMSTIV